MKNRDPASARRLIGFRLRERRGRRKICRLCDAARYLMHCSIRSVGNIAKRRTVEVRARKFIEIIVMIAAKADGQADFLVLV
jgi:hypothetical protein